MNSMLMALLGGVLIGLAVIGYLYINGRIAGISGLIAQLLQPRSLFKSSALWFLLGLLITPFIYQFFIQPEILLQSSPIALIIAGVLVGFGTRLGSGCTSGHGICGISRLSIRSIVATMIFMFAGIVTVYIARHLFGAML
ncbi:YeeE/YedE thiosulfate transporter family protein [Acinetobacter sp. NIPH 2699]|uniref:YeeE/YedE family protein n=1 Tax=Acinetobacter sp. NIPH 2699 TaxID=2923433 RepID=UPI001F4A71B1|nr:YeeE/YedE thiosulfate transporter family protein [Acinetobacter sp. NIPH 2699]MCH7335130.1 YeeE/YedE family protein [Acinetobacter sp. NIPH 2699]